MCTSKTQKTSWLVMVYYFPSYLSPFCVTRGRISDHVSVSIQNAWLAFTNLRHLRYRWHPPNVRSSSEVGFAIRLRNTTVESRHAKTFCVVLFAEYCENFVSNSKIEYRVLGSSAQSLEHALCIWNWSGKTLLPKLLHVDVICRLASTTQRATQDFLSQAKVPSRSKSVGRSLTE